MINRRNENRKNEDRGSAMVEAAIYLPVTLIILFIIVMLSVLRLRVFSNEADRRETAVRMANYLENDSPSFSKKYIYFKGGGQSPETLPTEEEISSYHSERKGRMITYHLSNEIWDGEERQSTYEVPEQFKALGVPAEAVVRGATAYYASRGGINRVVDMIKNDAQIEYLLGYDYRTLRQRWWRSH